MTRTIFLSGLLASLLAACTAPDPAGRLVEPDVSVTLGDGPPNSAPGTCWGRQTTPAVIETVTERTLITPAEVDDTGREITEAVYQTSSRQRIVTPRDEVWFETICPDQLTPEFTASLQRALKVRGIYDAGITGEMDERTQKAIRDYQATEGLDSPILTLAATRKLGLVAYEITQAPE